MVYLQAGFAAAVRQGKTCSSSCAEMHQISSEHACYDTRHLQVLILRPCIVAAPQQAPKRATMCDFNFYACCKTLPAKKSMMVFLQVMALRPRFVAAAQQAQQAEDGNGRVYDDDDIEAVKGMARLFAELGESYTALIATGTWGIVTVSRYLQQPVHFALIT